jgi:hypothetical protein
MVAHSAMRGAWVGDGRSVERGLDEPEEARPMHAYEKTLTTPVTRRQGRLRAAALLLPCRRALAGVLAALHDSRSREAARIVRRYRHLVEESRAPAPEPALAGETRRRQARGPKDALKPALIAAVIGFALVHGITLGILGPRASSDATIALRGD